MSEAKNAPKDKGGVIRVVSNVPFTMLPNELCRDKSLSWEARGMLAYLLSHGSNWETRLSDLINQSPAGRDQTKRILHEIEAAGYMHRRRVHNHKTGRFDWETTVYNAPQPPSTENPSMVNPSMVNPSPDNQSIYKEQPKKNKDKKKEQQHTAPAAPIDVVPLLVVDLVMEGVSPSQAQKLAQTKPASCRQQLDWLPHRKPAKNPAGALVKAILEDWAAPVMPGAPPAPPPKPEPTAAQIEQKRIDEARRRACAVKALEYVDEKIFGIRGTPPATDAPEFADFMWSTYDGACAKAQNELYPVRRR